MNEEGELTEPVHYVSFQQKIISTKWSEEHRTRQLGKNPIIFSSKQLFKNVCIK